MTTFLQHVLSGLAAGGVYGVLALAIVLIHRSTGVINVAQGELATLSAFLCWTLVDHGWAFWTAFGVTVALSFGGGVALQAIVLRPLQGNARVGVLLTVGLALAVNGLDTWVWGSAARDFPRAFSTGSVTIAGAVLSKQNLGVTGVSVAAALLVGGLLTQTRLGLGLRAAAASPAEARLVGVRLGAMLAVYFGLATALGAVAGVLAAPSFHLRPDMLQATLLYAFAAAVLGGLRSPVDAVAGGLALGVLLELVGAYVHRVGVELRPVTALALLAAVLLLRPSGLARAAPGPA